MDFDKTKIKELYPEAEDLMIKPMLIHASTDSQLKKACDSGDYFGQLKKDGALYQFVKTENYSYLFGRTISKKTGLLTEKIANVPHIKDALSCLPKDTIILGEIYYPGGSSKNAVEIMGCLPEKAIQRQNKNYGLIHFFIYDILSYDGVNLINAQVGNELRYKILEKVFYFHGLDKYDFLELAEVWYDNLYERVGDALAAGEEGMVIKKKDGIYQPDTRPMTNWKAKKVDFADVIIIGFEEPTKVYYGKDEANWMYWHNAKTNTNYPIGNYLDYVMLTTQEEFLPVTKAFYMGWHNSRIKIGAYDKNGNIINIGTIHSGISDEMKQDMTENPDKYLNHVCAIQCMEKDKVARTVRHGFFRYLRNDKDAKDCTIDSIF